MLPKEGDSALTEALTNYLQPLLERTLPDTPLGIAAGFVCMFLPSQTQFLGTQTQILMGDMDGLVSENQRRLHLFGSPCATQGGCPTSHNGAIFRPLLL